MINIRKPIKLSVGDRVATVSLSWGGAGDDELLWRYQLGKQRLEEQFGLKVVEMKNTLMGSEYLYQHPEKRAEDLMDAFSDPSIKAIFSCIGGEESVRMLPYIDFEVIRKNPKIFVGYSDSTITHLICLKAGLSSFYGPSVLAELAENNKIFDYTVDSLNNTLFCAEPIGEIAASEIWTGERIIWSKENAKKEKRGKKNQGYEVLQGTGIVTGKLIGGCIEVLEMAKGTEIWPSPEQFESAILFFETSEDMPEPSFLEYWLRNYGSQGILQRASALIFGKPFQEGFYEEYKKSILKILRELGLSNMPVLYNLTFGHNEPMFILPYGANAEVNCEQKTFTILDSGVIDK